MGGKGSGTSPGSHNHSAFKANKYTAQDADENTRIIEFAKELVKFELVDFTDGEEQWRRFEFLLDCCDKYNLRPSVPAMCMALGINSRVSYEMMNGRVKRFGGQEVTTLFIRNLQKMYNFIQLYLEESLIEEQKNPVKWIFLAKNHFGYTDTRENIIKTVDDKPRLASAEDVAAKYRKQLGKASQDVIEVPNLAETKPTKAKVPRRRTKK